MGPTLWLSFLDVADGRAAPRLRAGPDPGSPTIELSDRARWVLAAISIPRELAPETASDERQRMRLGPRLWSSGEITARIPYQHRSTIRHALTDLRRRLVEHDLILEDYLVIDTDRGCYGVRTERLAVDLVSLHEVRHDPDAVDRQLAAALGERVGVRLAPMCANVLADPTHQELDEVITASAARVSRPSPVRALDSRPEPDSEPPGTSEQSTSREPSRPPVPRRRLAIGLAGVAVVLAVGITLILLLQGGHGSQAAIRGYGPPRTEVSGGVAHTWSNPLTASGRAGPELARGERVRITCRVHGFAVPDGNTWWYLVGSRPWSNHFFATADAFYNDGRTHGSLHGSAFVDRSVPDCSPLPRSFR